MGMEVARKYGHCRQDIVVAEGREAFAQLVFDAIDRLDWWDDREKPWRRLSRMVSRSPQLLERIISEGASPRRETLERLEEETGTPREVWEYALRFNALDEQEEELSPSRRLLRQKIDDMPDELVDEFVRLFVRAQELQEENKRRGQAPTNAGE